GKAIAAYLPQDQQGALLAGQLAPLTGRTIVDPEVLAAELDTVRTAGYAREDQESTLGDAGLAAPVFDRAGLAGAIGLVGPVERLLAEGADRELAVKVREVAWQLSRELGAGRA